MSSSGTPSTSPTSPTPPHRRRRVHFSAGFLTALALVLLVGLAGGWYVGWLKPRPTVALVTNTNNPYWDTVIRGAQDAAAQCGVKLRVVRGTGDAAAQSAALRELLNQGVRGIGVSPVDGEAQADVLREVAQKMPLATIDSDSPNSNRQWFIGTENYFAGQACGSAVRDAIPDGGGVLICTASATTENVRQRRQGLIDELLDREDVPAPTDPVDAVLKGPKYTIVGTCVDQYDPARATQLVADAIKAHPDLKCIVGLNSYTAPAVLKALEQTNKLGQVQVIGFDIAPETVAAIDAGHVYATMRQAQYDFGYDTVRVLADALTGDGRRAASGSSPMRYFNVKTVTKENVDTVRAEVGHLPDPVVSAK